MKSQAVPSLHSELDALSRIVNPELEFAELQEIDHKSMYMAELEPQARRLSSPLRPRHSYPHGRSLALMRRCTREGPTRERVLRERGSGVALFGRAALRGGERGAQTARESADPRRPGRRQGEAKAEVQRIKVIATPLGFGQWCCPCRASSPRRDAI